MANWGFAIQKDNQIDYDLNNRSVFEQVYQSEPSLMLCIACGSCAGTCTASDFTGFSLRKINILASRGEMKNLKNEVSKCMLCGKCTLVCPRGVNTRNVLLNYMRFLNF
jgi:heterodisulfide reductase subunit C